MVLNYSIFMKHRKYTEAELHQLADQQNCIYVRSAYNSAGSFEHYFYCKTHQHHFKRQTSRIETPLMCPECSRQDHTTHHAHPFRNAAKHNINLLPFSAEELTQIRLKRDLKQYYELKIIQPVLKELAADLVELHLEPYQTQIMDNSRVILDYIKDHGCYINNTGIIVACLIYFFGKTLGVSQCYAEKKDYCTAVTVRAWYPKFPFAKIFRMEQLCLFPHNYCFFNWGF